MQAGVASWAESGLAGRGVLLDINNYRQEHHQRYEPWTTHQIPLEIIVACAEHQKVILKKGDILFFRVGYHAVYEQSSESKIKAKLS